MHSLWKKRYAVGISVHRLNTHFTSFAAIVWTCPLGLRNSLFSSVPFLTVSTSCSA